MSRSVSSMAACFPVSGRPPEPRPLVSLAPDRQLDRRPVAAQGLQVRVDGDEFHALDAGLDHPVDGVAAAASDADDLDLGPEGLLHEMEFQFARSVRRSCFPPILP